MFIVPKKLKLTVTKTSDGANEYVQIMSADQFSVNIVLIAEHIEILDARPAPAPEKGTKKK
jgi:hypothetical protein